MGNWHSQQGMNMSKACPRWPSQICWTWVLLSNTRVHTQTSNLTEKVFSHGLTLCVRKVNRYLASTEVYCTWSTWRFWKILEGLRRSWKALERNCWSRRSGPFEVLPLPEAPQLPLLGLLCLDLLSKDQLADPGWNMPSVVNSFQCVGPSMIRVQTQTVESMNCLHSQWSLRGPTNHKIYKIEFK